MALKDGILSELEHSRDGSVSGQALAARFGVSRNAVWKAVQALREGGVPVESTQSRGYRLAPGYDRVSAEGVRALLPEGVAVFAYDMLDSTNNQAKRLLADGAAAPFLVLAEAQSAGRGRRGRAFFSPGGAGLYMTAALAPGLAAQSAQGLTAYAAVCVAQTVESVCGARPRIKWVNDLYLDGKKVCGILTEATADMESGALEALIVGVGVNLRPSDVPEALQGIVGFVGCAGPVKNRLAAEITRGLLAYRADDGTFLPAYRERSLTLGRRVVWDRGGETVTGTAADVLANGALLLAGDDGQTYTVTSGEVQLPDGIG